jgi:hypothetical protein
MTNTTDQEITWGGQQPPSPRGRWSGKKTAAAIAIAVGVVVAGGVAVYAASGSAADAQQQQGAGPGMGRGGTGGGVRGGFGGVMDALHGTFTVSDGNGGYRTEETQTGEVTAITDTSLTAKSQDGYTKVYTINTATTYGGGTKADVRTGDTVTVVATPNGESATANNVLDRAQMPQGGPGGPGN